METTQQIILEALENLMYAEFMEFKWYLQQYFILEDLRPIPASRLEHADRMNTVDLMLQTYGEKNTITVTRRILVEINRFDLVVNLSDNFPQPTGRSLLKVVTVEVSYHSVMHHLICQTMYEVKEGETHAGMSWGVISKSNHLPVAVLFTPVGKLHFWVQLDASVPSSTSNIRCKVVNIVHGREGKK